MTSYAKRLEQRKQHEAIKEHEKELKDEKEAERQVRRLWRYKYNSVMLIVFASLISKESRSAEPRRKKRSGTTRWQRKCTISESSVSGGGKSATNCCIREQPVLDWMLFVCVFFPRYLPVARCFDWLHTVVFSPFDLIGGLFIPRWFYSWRLETGLRLQYLTENVHIHQQTGHYIHVDVLANSSSYAPIP